MKILKIQSSPDQVGRLEPYLKDVFYYFSLNQNIFPEVLISLTEAVSNAVIHGNNLEQAKQVEISATIEKKQLQITIQDEGSGFNPNQVDNPLLHSHREKEGGRGLLLMKELSGEVSFQQNGSLVVLFFKVAKQTYKKNCFFITENNLIFKEIPEEQINNWLNRVAHSYGFNISKLVYRLDSDEAVLLINKQYLNHDFYTDIITFDSRSQKQINSNVQEIAGDIIISYDRVAENAKLRGKSFQEELLTVMAHGLLHLIGFDDHSDEDTRAMRQAEADAINLFQV